MLPLLYFSFIFQGNRAQLTMAENQTVEKRGLKVLSAEMTSQEVEMN